MKLWRTYLPPALFIAPGFLLFLVCIVYPMLQAIQMSFFDWKLVAGAASTFLGLDNYVRAFNDPRFWLALSNSGIYMAFTVPPQIALGLGVALLLKDKGPAQPLFRVLYYLPVVTSWVVVSLLFKYLFADRGLINFALDDLLGATDKISWLAERWTALVRHLRAGGVEGHRLVDDDLPRGATGGAQGIGGGRRDRRRQPPTALRRRHPAGDLAGDDLRHHHAGDRRLQRLRPRCW